MNYCLDINKKTSVDQHSFMFVTFQMISYNFNPYTSHNSSRRIRSNIVSLVLKDDSSKVLDTINLPSDIEINIPTPNHGRDTNGRRPRFDRFLNLGSMEYRVITVNEVNTTMKVSITIMTPAYLTVYIKYGEHPTEASYDDAIHISKKSEYKNVGSQCQTGVSCFYDIFINCNVTGKYYVGLLGSNEDQTAQPRNRRSILSERAKQEKCVKFKDPPPTLATPIKSTIFVPQYDPERSVNYSFQVDTMWCAFWSDTEQRWTNKGCKVGTSFSRPVVYLYFRHLCRFSGIQH